VFKIIVDHEIELVLLDFFHAEELFKLIMDNDKYLREWLPWLDNNQTFEAMNAFIASTKKKFSENNGFEVAIRYKKQLAGILGVHPINWANKKTSIGYWIAEPFQGNGIITRSCKSVLDYLFNNYGLNRIAIECGVGNKKSRAIPERLGFVLEGILKDNEWLYDHYIDSAIYSMLKRDWEKG
jgi:ribosomal-protein-serine acetyltransferase